MTHTTNVQQYGIRRLPSFRIVCLAYLIASGFNIIFKQKDDYTAIIPAKMLHLHIHLTASFLVKFSPGTFE